MNNLLSMLLPRFSFQTSVFYSGEFCGSTQFRQQEQVGHLHLVRSGPVVMQHEEAAPLVIEEPSLIFYPRPFDHRLVVPPASRAELLCASITFRDTFRNPFAIALPDYVNVPLAQLSGLSTVLGMLFDEAGKEDVGKGLMMDRLCDIVVIHVIRHALTSGLVNAGVLMGLSDPGIASALLAIHENPARSWKVEDMAALAHMSRSKFAKHFQEVVGATPVGYLTQTRMALAENLLLANKAVKSVATAVGYSNQPAFTKAFIANFGMPPSAWLKQNRNS
jgi:AraC-like DNA-binding protein